MRSADDIRADFVLRPEVAHLNHRFFGATPRAVLERQTELLDDIGADCCAGNGHKWRAFGG